MSKHDKIDYVELPANDLDKAKSFYGEVFGWTFKDFGDDYCAFCDSGLNGGFYRAHLSSRTESGGALVVLYSKHLEKTQQKIEQAGGCIIRPIFPFPGGRRFQFTDPTGNELAVWSDK